MINSLVLLGKIHWFHWVKYLELMYSNLIILMGRIHSGSSGAKVKISFNDQLSRSFRKDPLVPVHCTACDSPSQSTHCHDGVSGENAFIDILVRNISDGQKRHLTT